MIFFQLLHTSIHLDIAKFYVLNLLQDFGKIGLQSCGPSNFGDDFVVQESNLGCLRVVQLWPSGRIFFKPPTLTALNSAAV